jgi:hypothetical protein
MVPYDLRRPMAVAMLGFLISIASIYLAIATELPKDLLPYDGVTVTAPPAFSWTPGASAERTNLYVSTEPDITRADIIDFQDDGIDS